MQLVFHCPVCQSPNVTSVTGDQPRVACHGCDWIRETAPGDLQDDQPRRCLACGNDDLWRQKDFPQAIGLLLVATGAILSTIAWYSMRPILAISILMGFALIDLLLFVLMPDVLVCYRCRARHRKARMNEDHPRFNLELAERYRQEAIRLEEAGQLPKQN